jgi:anti-anti-sigma regulatory factor
VPGFRMAATLRRTDEAHVTLEGPVDAERTPQVIAMIQALITAGARQLFVDLARVHECDPALTGYLDRQRRQIMALGGWMVVDGSPSTMRLDTTPLTEIFDVYRRVTRPGRMPVALGA